MHLLVSTGLLEGLFSQNFATVLLIYCTANPLRFVSHKVPGKGHVKFRRANNVMHLPGGIHTRTPPAEYNMPFSAKKLV